MHLISCRWLFFQLFFLLSILSYAQVYPVQSTVIVTPPYSPYLTDYTSVGSQRFTVQLRANDVSISNYLVKLRLVIEGLNITISTKPNFIQNPITLDGSILLLTGSDLRELFNPNNLDFSGLTKRQYETNGKLPDGIYKFSIEVLDFNRGTLVSNRGSTSVWIILNDPPILNLPRTSTKVPLQGVTNILFNWTPRHTGSVNSAFTTQYYFRLFEIWPNDRNPNDAVLSQLPIFESTTSENRFVYGPAEPDLIPGKKYAWQVQARDTEGRDLFKNAGKSEVFWFQFGEELATPINLRKEYIDDHSVTLRWEPPASGTLPEKYRISYRGQSNSNWWEIVTENLWFTIADLLPETDYQIKVRSEKLSQRSDYGPVLPVKTTDQPILPRVDCGPPSEVQINDTLPPLQTLRPGDHFRCYDFDIKVSDITGRRGNGNFSGLGWQEVKLFNYARIKVSFSGVINAEYVLISGSVDAIPSAPGENAFTDYIEEAERIGELAREDALAELGSAASEESYGSIPYVINGTIDTVYMTEDDKITIIDSEGNVKTLEHRKNPDGSPVIVSDSQGNMYRVAEDGKVEKVDHDLKYANASTPNAVDVSKLDDFEKIVKQVIDSLYSIDVAERDSLGSIKNRDQELLDEKVDEKDRFERSLVGHEDDPEYVDTDYDVTAVMTEIFLLDSLVEISFQAVKKFDARLTKLNGWLDGISNFGKELKSLDACPAEEAIPARKRKITNRILQKLAP